MANVLDYHEQTQLFSELTAPRPFFITPDPELSQTGEQAIGVADRLEELRAIAAKAEAEIADYPEEEATYRNILGNMGQLLTKQELVRRVETRREGSSAYNSAASLIRRHVEKLAPRLRQAMPTDVVIIGDNVYWRHHIASAPQPVLCSVDNQTDQTIFFESKPQLEGQQILGGRLANTEDGARLIRDIQLAGLYNY